MEELFYASAVFHCLQLSWIREDVRGEVSQEWCKCCTLEKNPVGDRGCRALGKTLLGGWMPSTGSRGIGKSYFPRDSKSLAAAGAEWPICPICCYSSSLEPLPPAASVIVAARGCCSRTRDYLGSHHSSTPSKWAPGAGPHSPTPSSATDVRASVLYNNPSRAGRGQPFWQGCHKLSPMPSLNGTVIHFCCLIYCFTFCSLPYLWVCSLPFPSLSHATHKGCGTCSIGWPPLL